MYVFVSLPLRPRPVLDLHGPRASSVTWDAWAGCDVTVEEEETGGAWRGDVFPRWQRESEETVFTLGLLLGEFYLHPQPTVPVLFRPWATGEQAPWSSSSSGDEIVNVESLGEAAWCWPWSQPLLWEFGGVGAGRRAGRRSREKPAFVVTLPCPPEWRGWGGEGVWPLPREGRNL